MSQLAIDIFRTNCSELKPIPTGLEPRLTKLSSIEAIMFDVYGTLFISGSGDVGHAAANPKVRVLEQAAQASDVDLGDASDQVLERFYENIRESHRESRLLGIEFPEVDILAIWKKTLGKHTPEETLLQRLAIEFESKSNPVWPMPKLHETLLELGQTRRLGIVSNAQFFTLDLFEAFLNQDRVELGFDTDLEVFSFAEGQAKPGTEIYDIAAKRLTKKGVQPENVLYVGNDMLNDIKGAQAVGFRTGLFAGDQRSLRLRKEDKRVDGIRPDIIVNCLTQITECME